MFLWNLVTVCGRYLRDNKTSIVIYQIHECQQVFTIYKGTAMIRLVINYTAPLKMFGGSLPSMIKDRGEDFIILYQPL